MMGLRFPEAPTSRAGSIMALWQPPHSQPGSVGGNQSPERGNQDEYEFSGTAGELWQPHRQPGYMDLVLPPPGFTVWDLPKSKVQAAAAGLTFTAAAALISAMAIGGVLAILFIGALVSASVLLLITVCTGLIVLTVTGVPLGYAIWTLISRMQAHHYGRGARVWEEND